MKKIGIYPGTFDPITNGHVDIVKRASHLFEKLIVAVAASARKSPYFNLKDRLAMCKEVFAKHKNIKVLEFDQLIVDFARVNKANYIVKGLRSAVDFDYEFQMAGMNKKMAPNIETIFLPANDSVAFISATQVREIVAMAGDVKTFVPREILKYLKK